MLNHYEPRALVAARDPDDAARAVIRARASRAASRSDTVTIYVDP